MQEYDIYTFKHYVSLIPTITIEIYGDEKKALEALSLYVINIKDWRLIKSNYSNIKIK